MKVAKAIAAALAAFGALYLAFAFGNWSFDAGTWDDKTRGLCAVWGFIGAGYAFSMTMMSA